MLTAIRFDVHLAPATDDVGGTAGRSAGFRKGIAWPGPCHGARLKGRNIMKRSGQAHLQARGGGHPKDLGKHVRGAAFMPAARWHSHPIRKAA